ncbi:hypothetical protein AAZX31_14G093400 [Glycine max]|uniref:Uncharacterized protein n=2 Tax=Glycine subgen. Soja TaxID=1462606 RepID=K7M5V7_SOYBN|nr:uncharacterized protein LOC100814552 [Glycine max]XP_028198879.1 uncharacterized protein LOC114383404 [Glycine soja]KAG4962599.1 hypothetical protein JHK86_039467 [Glycine max]KAG4965071.1 hypothetical protein JHK85_040046 [Glycine max]KAG5110066.1 hypothetical protein JHK82_039289 [Glycine max]KAH1093814.1 hypothetical protein GYH30_039507 [Glycine max]KAH1212351.1 hypothetical protein GmHk_14G040577 [Glycine max]|eukprot:XP_003544523.2 uncharacterized protein LOC100814552 [Glycine max]
MNLNHYHHHVPPYEHMLKESINRFFAEHRRGATDFADFTSIFSRMIHATPEPPIPLLWFYAALEFRATRDPSRRARDLFHLLVSCSGARGSTKQIAALAPLLFVLHRLALLQQGELLKTELNGLVEGVVSYCSICCGSEICRDDDVAVLEFGDLIKVWMVDDHDHDGGVLGFFPFVSGEFKKGIEKGCEVGVLAGIVMWEALLLKLCLAFEKGIGRAEQEKKLMASAVQTITGFRSFGFLDALFRMMLERVLPVTSLLGSENEVLLKEVLYNSVMMIDYSFINPQAEFLLYANSLKDVAIIWLFVAELAVQSAREKGDHGKAMSYINAFCRSCIPIQLINWVTNQNCVGRKITRPNVSTPIALIKWLIVVEEQGIAVFAGETAKQINIMFKANFFTSRTECLLPVIKHFFNNLDKNLYLNSVNGEAGADKLDGDVEMLDTADTVSLPAADSVNRVIDGTRKRKEGIEDDTKTQLKYMRCQFHENSVRENSFIFRQQ